MKKSLGIWRGEREVGQESRLALGWAGLGWVKQGEDFYFPLGYLGNRGEVRTKNGHPPSLRGQRGCLDLRE